LLFSLSGFKETELSHVRIQAGGNMNLKRLQKKMLKSLYVEKND